MNTKPDPRHRITPESSTEGSLMKLRIEQQEVHQQIIQDLGFLLAQDWLDRQASSNANHVRIRKARARRCDGELPFE